MHAIVCKGLQYYSADRHGSDRVLGMITKHALSMHLVHTGVLVLCSSAAWYHCHNVEVLLLVYVAHYFLATGFTQACTGRLPFMVQHICPTSCLSVTGWSCWLCPGSWLNCLASGLRMHHPAYQGKVRHTLQALCTVNSQMFTAWACWNSGCLKLWVQIAWERSNSVMHQSHCKCRKILPNRLLSHCCWTCCCLISKNNA